MPRALRTATIYPKHNLELNVLDMGDIRPQADFNVFACHRFTVESNDTNRQTATGYRRGCSYHHTVGDDVRTRVRTL